MNNEKNLPVLDMAVLQEKATEFAMRGAIESIKEYYSGYNSPYRKIVEAELAETKLGPGIDIPDILVLINDALSKEIDIIANQAVANTFIPMVSRFLAKTEKEVPFSKILEEFIEATEAEYGDCEVSVEKSRHMWLDVEIKTTDRAYSLCLHKAQVSHNEDNKPTPKYRILSLPRHHDPANKYSQTMKVRLADGATLEMPFTKAVLDDEFMAFCGKMLIGGSLITMDCTDFNEDMFPE